MYYKDEYLEENPVVVRKLMETAVSFSELSKCAAKKVGCVLYKDGNIISIGVNGTTAGKLNCNEKFKKIDGVWHMREANEWKECDADSHYTWSLYNETHSEINAISKALVPVNGAIAFVTYSPCFNCAKSFAVFGISKVYYMHEYDDFENVRGFLHSEGIELVKVTL